MTGEDTRQGKGEIKYRLSQLTSVLLIQYSTSCLQSANSDQYISDQSAGLNESW